MRKRLQAGVPAAHFVALAAIVAPANTVSMAGPAVYVRQEKKRMPSLKLHRLRHYTQPKTIHQMVNAAPLLNVEHAAAGPPDRGVIVGNMGGRSNYITTNI